MTNQHPLTNEICEEISSCIKAIKLLYQMDLPDPYVSSRDIADDLRSAADWQLEQVVEWLRNNLDSGCYLTSVGYPGEGYRDEIDTYEVVDDLKKAMRPTGEQQ